MVVNSDIYILPANVRQHEAYTDGADRSRPVAPADRIVTDNVLIFGMFV
jgi:hypothetical protein